LAGGGLPCILVVPFCSLLLGVFRLMGFRFCGLALAVPVYLGASYAFINKVFLLIKKKSTKINLRKMLKYVKLQLNLINFLNEIKKFENKSSDY
jgi:hypothetical protein